MELRTGKNGGGGRGGGLLLLTNHMQEEEGCVRAEVVLCICCHLEDACTLIHVPDAILNGAEVGIGHSHPISKVKLDVCPLEVTLQGNRNWSGPLHKHLKDIYLTLIHKVST